MTATVRGPRPQGRRGAPQVHVPSVREVCLLGAPEPAPAWVPGERVEWAGRAYRVTATQAGAGAAAAGTHYVYLSPAADR
jgi:hypothetical protein